MQQLQGQYGGDRSDTLAQIMGMDYDPQGQMAQMANTMLQVGMSSGSALKRQAMSDDAQLNRMNLERQYQMIAGKRKRREDLQDEMRKRQYALEDSEMLRSQKLEDAQTARSQQLEDMDYRNRSDWAARLFSRGSDLMDREYVSGINEAALEEESLGKLLGADFILQSHIDAMDDNDPKMAKEKQAMIAMQNKLRGMESGISPRAKVAMLEKMFGFGVDEPVFSQQMSRLRKDKVTEFMRLMDEIRKFSR